MSRSKTQLTKPERNLLLAVALFVALVAGAWGYWEWINVDPVVSIPAPVMPTPNAFDYYKQATEAFRIVAPTVASALGNPQKEEALPISIRQAEIARQAKMLALLHEGFKYNYHEPPTRSLSSQYGWGYFGRLRQVGRFLRMQAKTQAATGDWAGALDSQLDCLHVCEDLPHGGTLISALFAYVLQQEYGRTTAWETVGHLRVADAKAGVRRLEGIISRHVPTADILTEEKWMREAHLMTLFKSSGWRSESLNDVAPGLRKPPLSFLIINERQAMADFDHHMNILIANTRLPYATKVVYAPIHNSPFTDIFYLQNEFVREKLHLREVAADTKNRLLLLGLALHAYKLEHGANPKSLTDLAPTYLTKIPDDPFALSGTFHYANKGKTYLLYSLGPDSIDDGGTPITDKSLKSTSTGDIVAGVNTR